MGLLPYEWTKFSESTQVDCKESYQAKCLPRSNILVSDLIGQSDEDLFGTNWNFEKKMEGMLKLKGLEKYARLLRRDSLEVAPKIGAFLAAFGNCCVNLLEINLFCLGHVFELDNYLLASSEWHWVWILTWKPPVDFLLYVSLQIKYWLHHINLNWINRLHFSYSTIDCIQNTRNSSICSNLHLQFQQNWATCLFLCTAKNLRQHIVFVVFFVLFFPSHLTRLDFGWPTKWESAILDFFWHIFVVDILSINIWNIKLCEIRRCVS